MRKLLLLASVLILPLAACDTTANDDGEVAAPASPAFDGTERLAEADEAAEVIDAEYLRQTVAALAADEMEGRGPGSEGDRKARQYLIAQMQQLGLQPAGPGGSWEQPFDMVGITAKAPPTWTFRGPSGEAAFARQEDFMASSGVQREAAALDDAEVVFVGYGIEAPEYEWDDYKGADLDG
ncbi:MAG TPA: peptidase M28, partial [Thermoanaerobaculia bacterium]|nr:peptidase M28 [Thermoanaerobaculia bacterium]